MCKLPLYLIEMSGLMSSNTHCLQYSFITFGIPLSLNDITILSLRDSMYTFNLYIIVFSKNYFNILISHYILYQNH